MYLSFGFETIQICFFSWQICLKICNLLSVCFVGLQTFLYVSERFNIHTGLKLRKRASNFKAYLPWKMSYFYVFEAKRWAGSLKYSHCIKQLWLSYWLSSQNADKRLKVNLYQVGPFWSKYENSQCSKDSWQWIWNWILKYWI